MERFNVNEMKLREGNKFETLDIRDAYVKLLVRYTLDSK